MTLGGAYAACAIGRHLWEVSGPFSATCSACDAESDFTSTELIASNLFAASHGKALGESLLQTILDRNAHLVVTIDEE